MPDVVECQWSLFEVWIPVFLVMLISFVLCNVLKSYHVSTYLFPSVIPENSTSIKEYSASQLHGFNDIQILQ